MSARNLRARSIALAAATCFVMSACASVDQGVTADRATQDEGSDDDGPLMGGDEPIEPGEFPITPGVIEFGEGKPPQEYDGYLIAAIQDIEVFWQEEFAAAYGTEWFPLQQGIHAGWAERQTPWPTECGVGTWEDDFSFNAFYCGGGDYMGYDDTELFPRLNAQLGPEALAIVMAHEYGHRVQAVGGVFQQDLPTIITELQADCFAGAWAAHAARGEGGQIVFDDSDVRSSLISMLFIRDGAETDVDGVNAHGTGFDRVSNFQEGFNGGVAACVPLDNAPLPLVDIDFSADDPTGNLPYADIAPLIGDDLERFWTSVLETNGFAFTPPSIVPFTAASVPTCPDADASLQGNVVWCPSDNTIYLDDDYAQGLYRTRLPDTFEREVTLGDMSVGFLLSQAYGQAVQSALGIGGDAVARSVLSDCLTGVWVSDIVPTGNPDVDNNKPLRLSAGDLDEIVITSIVRADMGDQVSAFDRIDAFENGLRDGLPGCQG